MSGAQAYKALCLAARNEEKRLAELRKRKQYQQPVKDTPKPAREKAGEVKGQKSASTTLPATTFQSGMRKCYVCHKTGHIARECSKRTESRGQRNDASSKQVVAK